MPMPTLQVRTGASHLRKLTSITEEDSLFSSLKILAYSLSRILLRWDVEISKFELCLHSGLEIKIDLYKAY